MEENMYERGRKIEKRQKKKNVEKNLKKEIMMPQLEDLLIFFMNNQNVCGRKWVSSACILFSKESNKNILITIQTIERQRDRKKKHIEQEKSGHRSHASKFITRESILLYVVRFNG